MVVVRRASGIAGKLRLPWRAKWPRWVGSGLSGSERTLQKGDIDEARAAAVAAFCKKHTQFVRF
jgi:hypothetical protein